MSFLSGAFLFNIELDSVMAVYFIPVYTVISRFAMPIFAFAVIYGGALSLKNAMSECSARASLISSAAGEHIPLPYNENVVGRESSSDIIIDIPTVSRKHAVIRRGNNTWSISDLASRTGIKLNGEPMTDTAILHSGDYIELGGAEYMFNAAINPDIYISEPAKTLRKGVPALRTILDRKPPPQGRLLFYMLVFQLMACVQVIFRADTEYTITLAAGFVVYLSIEVLYFLFHSYILKRGNFTHELFGFYLTGIGLCIIASSEPSRLIMQLVIIVISLALYIALFSIMRNQLLILRLRPYLAALGTALFAVNLIFGTSRFGSKNWLEIFGFSFQPSELVKVIIVLTGAAALEKLSDRRDVLLFSLYSCACILCLFIMGDFGTAAIFFITFIIIFIMRTGKLGLASGICLAAVLGMAVIALTRPYILSRFAAWRHVWEYPATTGYQQTRTLIAAASGGLPGVGIGAGYLRNVAAATTDLVFGVLCEEWGLITAIISVSAIALLGILACRGIKTGKSAYYATAACAAAGLLIFQACLNIFGSTDILPLTGVTLPFISRGGSSMLSCWMLLAVLKVSHNWEYKGAA